MPHKPIKENPRKPKNDNKKQTHKIKLRPQRNTSQTKTRTSLHENEKIQKLVSE